MWEEDMYSGCMYHRKMEPKWKLLENISYFFLVHIPFYKKYCIKYFICERKGVRIFSTNVLGYKKKKLWDWDELLKSIQIGRDVTKNRRHPVE